MFRIEKSFRFEAAHRLSHHDGKCRRLHGHSFRGVLVCEDYDLGMAGPKSGMVVDFGDLSAAVKPLLDEFLDHHDLNATTGLESPTSEELARWIFNHLCQVLPSLVEVQVEETCTSKAIYRPVRRESV